MPTIRDDIYPVVDAIRDEVVDEVAGLRLHDVVVVTRTWSGGERGRGTPTEEPLALTPRPRVRDPNPRERMAEAGRFEDGDRVVDKISVAYTRAQLDGGQIGSAAEVFWTISGVPYRVVQVTEKFLQWEVQLRVMRTRPG